MAASYNITDWYTCISHVRIYVPHSNDSSAATEYKPVCIQM